jgi:hypothetical protein
VAAKTAVGETAFNKPTLSFRKTIMARFEHSPRAMLSGSLIVVKISAGVEFNWAILAEFKWKITDVTTPDQDQGTEKADGTRLFGQFDMEITLTKHLHPQGPEKEVEQYKYFTADVLRPRLFHVRLEEGKFPLPEDLSWTGPSAKTPYTKQLVFNSSPYPPESEWKESWVEFWKDPDTKNFWDQTTFVNYCEYSEEFPAPPRSIGLEDEELEEF